MGEGEVSQRVLIYLAFFKTVFGSQSQQVEAYPRSEFTEQISDVREIQKGNTRKHRQFCEDRRIGTFIDFKEA